MCDGADARLLPFNDSVWRRSFHSGEEGCDGPVAADSDAVSGRLAVARAVSRFRGRGPALAVGAGEGWPVLRAHARRPAYGAAHPAAPPGRPEASPHVYRPHTSRPT